MKIGLTSLIFFIIIYFIIYNFVINNAHEAMKGNFLIYFLHCRYSYLCLKLLIYYIISYEINQVHPLANSSLHGRAAEFFFLNFQIYNFDEY